MRALVAVASLVVGVSAADAENVLSGDALKAAVSGKTIHLQTPVGTLPIVYAANGTLRGKQGTVASMLGGNKPDQGRWWVSNRQLCQRWNTWLDAETRCYTLRRDGDIVHWVRDDGRRGTARIASQ